MHGSVASAMSALPSPMLPHTATRAHAVVAINCHELPHPGSHAASLQANCACRNNQAARNRTQHLETYAQFLAPMWPAVGRHADANMQFVLHVPQKEVPFIQLQMTMQCATTCGLIHQRKLERSPSPTGHTYLMTFTTVDLPQPEVACTLRCGGSTGPAALAAWYLVMLDKTTATANNWSSSN